MPNKKKKAPMPWVLANNPDMDNQCNCFDKEVPSAKWIVVQKFPDQQACEQALNSCASFFVKMPLKKPQEPTKKANFRRRKMG